jgi:hypothetical protein
MLVLASTSTGVHHREGSGRRRGTLATEDGSGYRASDVVEEGRAEGQLRRRYPRQGPSRFTIAHTSRVSPPRLGVANGWSSTIRCLLPREDRLVPAGGLLRPPPSVRAEIHAEASLSASDGRNRGCPPCFPGLAATVQAAGCRLLRVEGGQRHAPRPAAAVRPGHPPLGCPRQSCPPDARAPPDASGPTGRSKPTDAPGLPDARSPRNFREPKWLMLPKTNGLERAVTGVKPAVRTSQGEEARRR